MIGSLRGELLDRSDSGALIEVRGVGYRVQATPSTLAALGTVGSEVFVHVYHHIREDSQTLFGFVDSDGREVFETLLGTHGVGPALALAILGVHSPSSLRRIIAEDDVAAMCLVPGVGKKTAQRLMIELKSRLGSFEGESSSVSIGDTANAAPDVRRDVRDALAGLGYSPEEIAAATSDLPTVEDASEGIRLALQRLAGG
ncbi:MAG: Holliday junction branch migration protein RuvA [Microthrixaceae bacterium]|nr:Holliday junction branch migration protein RuvA [Microthrixaceae bacterium]